MFVCSPALPCHPVLMQLNGLHCTDEWIASSYGWCVQVQWAGTFRSRLSKQQRWWWQWFTWRRSWHVWHALLQLQWGWTHLTRLSNCCVDVGRWTRRGAGRSALSQAVAIDAWVPGTPARHGLCCSSEAEQISRLVVEKHLLYMLCVLLMLCIPFQISQAFLM